MVKRILAGEAPANLIELLRRYFGLSHDVWGKDVALGNYAWLTKPTDTNLDNDNETAGPSGADRGGA